MGFGYRLTQYWTFDRKEQRDMLLTSVIMIFVLFFFLWAKYPNTDITVRTGPISVVNILILYLVSYGLLVAMIGTAKAVAIYKKYTATYSSWFNGLLIGFVITFASYGLLPVLFPGVVTLNKIETMRYGHPQEGVNKRAIFWTMTFSLLMMIIIAIILQQLQMTSGSFVLEGARDLVALILLYSILPFPHNYGSHLFFTKKKTYFVLAFFIISFSISLLFNSPYAIIIGLAGGALLWLTFPKYVSHHFFKE